MKKYTDNMATALFKGLKKPPYNIAHDIIVL